MPDADNGTSTQETASRSSRASLSLHDAARRNFDERAEDLLLKIERLDPKEREEGQRMTSDVYASDTISLDDIVGVPSCRVVERVTQKLLAVELLLGDERYHLAESAAFENLCADVAARRELRTHVGRATVEERLIRWFGDTIQHGQRSRFTDSLLDWLGEHLEPMEIWVPIANLHLESELPFGEVVLRPVRRALIDNWIQNLPKHWEEERRRQWESKIRKRAQGHAAAVCQLETDARSALSVAAMLAEEAVTLLRLVGPEVMFPEAKSCVHLRGRECLESHEAWIVSPAGFRQMLGEVLKPYPEPLQLTDDTVAELRRHITSLSSLLEKTTPSEFQVRLLRALHLYSESTLARSPGEKLRIIVTALETILIKDDKESLQQNLGERMSFFVSDDVDERLRFVSLARDCYSIRSRYVHHGQEPRDLEQLRTFMRLTFTFFIQMLWEQDEYSTQDELLRRLDRMKLSGP